MRKFIAALALVSTSLLMGCSLSSSPRAANSVTHTEKHTASNQADLDEGARRINAFKQELLGRGFRVTSTSSTESTEWVTLNGQYGKLSNLELTLWTSSSMVVRVNDPHLGASAHTQVGSKEEEDEFESLKQRLAAVVNDVK